MKNKIKLFFYLSVFFNLSFGQSKIEKVFEKETNTLTEYYLSKKNPINYYINVLGKKEPICRYKKIIDSIISSDITVNDSLKHYYNKYLSENYKQNKIEWSIDSIKVLKSGVLIRKITNNQYFNICNYQNTKIVNEFNFNLYSGLNSKSIYVYEYEYDKLGNCKKIKVYNNRIIDKNILSDDYYVYSSSKIIDSIVTRDPISKAKVNLQFNKFLNPDKKIQVINRDNKILNIRNIDIDFCNNYKYLYNILKKGKLNLNESIFKNCVSYFDGIESEIKFQQGISVKPKKRKLKK